ncbi:OsmC family protein [Rufibacter tibetensis]|uniref:Osmotically inducible protein OsmC n=1 Tax=Rufibacter tibetensis TaxID=512763 RepID=A0A0P0CVJ0_9BACT|nr:OsmC family protein [Rufibacter tibetensis]ALI98388.1 osmotically inducible protein OsmC [Rufibacter tibetensis]
MIRIEMNRVGGDYGFEAKDANGHVITTDTSPESGGMNFGVRPMQMMLMALGGCSGIDVAMIMKKKRQEVKGFKMDISGERETGTEPSLWSKVHVVFELQGDLDLDKAQRACDLSMGKYCSVAETLRRAGAQITWEVKITPASAQ